MGHPQPLFKHFNFTTNKCAKMSIQYTVLGFEPTTFGHESSPITTRSGLLLKNLKITNLHIFLKSLVSNLPNDW